TDVVVRNVCDRDRADPRRGGDRRLGSGGNSGGNDRSRRDGAVAGSASRSSRAPPRGLGSPAGYWIRRRLKRQYEDALAAPLSPRLATLITQLATQDVSA